MKQAVWKNIVIAEASEEDIIIIEGNVYFPPDSIKKEFFKRSYMRSTCPWKGEAFYYDLVLSVEDDDKKNESAAWYYPDLKKGALSEVGEDFSYYVSFWRGVEVR